VGYFRRYRAAQHSIEECRREETLAVRKLIKVFASWEFHSDNTSNRDFLDAALEDWACWRECRARLEGENESEIR